MKKINCELTDEEYNLLANIMTHSKSVNYKNWDLYCSLSSKLVNEK